MRNVHDTMADVTTAFDKRFGQTFDGPSILVGTLVEYIPIDRERKVKSTSELTDNVERNLFGLFPRAGGGCS